jgi:hypothetical protein
MAFLRAEAPVSDLRLEPLCLGRLMLALPEDRVLTDASGKVDDVSVEAIRDAGVETAALVDLEKFALTDSGADRSLIVNERRDGAVWLGAYRVNDMMDEASAVRALRLDTNPPLRLDSVGEGAYLKEIAGAVSRVARALDPIPESGRPPAGTFCFANGFGAAIPYGGYYEGVIADYDIPGLGTLTLTTHSNGDEVPPGLQELIAKGSDDLRAVTGEAPTTLALSEARNRTFGGAAAIVKDSSATRLLIWRVPGKTRAPYDPLIELRLRTSAPEGDAESAFAAIIATVTQADQP